MTSLVPLSGSFGPERALAKSLNRSLAYTDAQATLAHAKATAIANVGAAELDMMGALASKATEVVKMSPASEPFVRSTLMTLSTAFNGVLYDLQRL